MKNYLLISLSLLFNLSFCSFKGSLLSAQSFKYVKGIVYHDINSNGLYDKKVDIPLENIAVSNGRDVVLSDKNGSYELPLTKNPAIFVIKPPNWKLAEDKNNLSLFYFLHKLPENTGTPQKKLSAETPLAQFFNFPLYPSNEPDSFNVLVLGDTQSRDENEIYYFSNDVLPELIDLNVSFGITLGDIVFDKLNLYDQMISTLSAINVPMYYIPGNHDSDYSGNTQEKIRAAWYDKFGPAYYSFSYGPVHFIALDNIKWIVNGNKPFYRTGLGEDQMQFLKNEIERLDKNKLLILLSHIPIDRSTAWYDEAEKLAFFELIATHPNIISLSAHSHRHFHHFIYNIPGFTVDKPLHIISIGTSCGSLWTGVPDEYGIPHAMMSDGTPNCYTILHINKNDWKLSWKASRRPSDFQMHIYAPEQIKADSTQNIKIIANIFNALPSADVKMKIGARGEWNNMKRRPQQDPYRIKAAEREKEIPEINWRPLGNANISEHIWAAEPEINLSPGTYVIYIKANDKWWEYEGKKIIHVK